MAGNVWEWNLDKYEPGGAFRVIRGGSWSKNLLNSLTVEKSRAMVRTVAAEFNLPLSGVKDTLLAVQQDEPAYLAWDPHWSVAGHRAVAAQVLQALPKDWFATPDAPRAGATILKTRSGGS